MALTRILLIEDEPALLDLLHFNLRQAGYESIGVSTGQEGIAKAKETRPALVVLDLMLPDIDGIEVCRRLKRDADTRPIPILILTARSEEVDRVLGLEIGADDYVTKPFSPRELVLRIRAILRRGEEISEEPRQFQFGPIGVDVTKPVVLLRGIPIPLTALEIRLLHHLYRTRGKVQSRAVLLESVWGYQSVIHTRTVDVHIKRLREKLKGAGEFIETIRGLGYRLRESP